MRKTAKGEFRVRVKVVNKKDQVVGKEMAFDSEEDRAVWLANHEDEIIEILAYSDPF